MAEHVWSVLCSRSVVDQETKQASLFDVLEAVSITLFEPHLKEVRLVAFPTEVVSLWVATSSGEKAVCQCEIILPDGTCSHRVELEMDFTQKKRLRSTFRADALPLSESGTYRFNVSSKIASGAWGLVASLPLDVTVIQGEIPNLNDKKALKKVRTKRPKIPRS